MKRLRVWLTAMAILAAVPAVLLPANAQVTQVDAQMASSAIMNAGSRAARVKTITKVPSVGVIRLDFGPVISFWSDLPDPAEYRIMVSRNQAGVNKLRQALRANPATREALASRGISPSQVAGAQISFNGSLRLYIFSR
jgi:hypothetical protein